MQTFRNCWTLLSIFDLTVYGAPANDRIKYEKQAGSFVWASVGDSWASGISFDGSNTDYDENKNGCHRWRESYGPLMEANTDWTEIPQKFHFAACAGAQLNNIFKDEQGANPRQMDLVTESGEGPRMITYHAGGNNCDFGGVVGDCVYPIPEISLGGINYPPEFPDPEGPCARRIDAANRYIDSQSREAGKGLYIDELNTMRDVLGHPAVKNNKDFRFYVLGYAHFFNLEDNYCGNLTFAPLASLGGKPPRLSPILRKALNDAVERVNSRLRQAVDDTGDPRIKYIDISPAFDGHRFCEGAHDKDNDQWYNSDVWFWNLNLPGNDPPADSTVTGSMDGLWIGRRFHPKKGGTQAIMNIIINQAQRDHIPGVIQPPRSTRAGSCVRRYDQGTVGGTECVMELVFN